MSDPVNTPTQAQLEASLERYKAEAHAVLPSAWQQPKVGLGDFMKETHGVLTYAQGIWEVGPQGAPPLKVARLKYAFEGFARLSGLLEALQCVSAKEIAAANPASDLSEKLDRAEFLTSELNTALSFVLDDGIEEPADEKLDSIQDETKDASESGASIGLILLAWGMFAQEEHTRLALLDDFDLSLIDEAISLGKVLTSTVAVASAERIALRSLRLGIYTLVHAELQKLRQAAAYAYRRHPDIKLKFSSALERNRRAQARLQKKLADITPATTPATTP